MPQPLLAAPSIFAAEIVDLLRGGDQAEDRDLQYMLQPLKYDKKRGFMYAIHSFEEGYLVDFKFEDGDVQVIFSHDVDENTAPRDMERVFNQLS